MKCNACPHYFAPIVDATLVLLGTRNVDMYIRKANKLFRFAIHIRMKSGEQAKNFVALIEYRERNVDRQNRLMNLNCN